MYERERQLNDMQLGPHLRVAQAGTAEWVEWTWNGLSVGAIRMESGRGPKKHGCCRDGKLVQVALEIRRILIANLVFLSCQSTLNLNPSSSNIPNLVHHSVLFIY